MKQRDFIPLNIALLTVSDTRTEQTDTSGQYLAQAVAAAGHHLAGQKIIADDIYRIRAIVSAWIAEAETDAVICTGGTGLTFRDGTPEAISPLLDKQIEGFGELFRALSYEQIQTSSLQSRCMAGMANGTFVFSLPGSRNACETGWSKLIQPQLDHRTSPCNLVMLYPRLKS